MIDSQKLKKENFKSFNFSREILDDFDKFASLVVEKNKTINLISSSTVKTINSRHILDSAQIIDLIDKNDIKNCTDIGSGAGFPGAVLGLIMKRKKPLFKMVLYEKSYHKSNFLQNISKDLKINLEVRHKNIFEEKNLKTDVIISRAFKPLPIIFKIAFNNFIKFKYIIIYLGKSGRKVLEEALENWKFDYEQFQSQTSPNSMILKISNLKKK